MPSSSRSSTQRFVLTGCGWVTPLASGTIRDVLQAARCGDHACPSGQSRWAVADGLVAQYPDLSNELKRDKGAWMTAIALVHACRSASLDTGTLDAERTGMVLGSSLAGQLGMIGFANEVRSQGPRFVSPIHFPQTVGNYVSGALARSFGFKGPTLTLASGAASGLEAIAEGCSALAAGSADVVFAGGTDELSDDLVDGLADGLVDPGVVFSEGACVFVLERVDSAAARGAVPIATVTGYTRYGADQVALPSPHEAIVSGAGCCQPGAILVEHWVGHCCGALGAAAVAAAIGAADGREVPILGTADRASVVKKSLPVNDFKAADGSIRSVVQADADGAYTIRLDLAIPPVS